MLTKLAKNYYLIYYLIDNILLNFTNQLQYSYLKLEQLLIKNHTRTLNIYKIKIK